MIKRISAILTALLLCLAFPIAVFAASSLPKLTDEAGLLSEAEFQEVNNALDAVSETYDADIAVLTVNGLGGKTIRDFADDYYDENGYGTGDDKSGVLWVIDMDSRESYITTSGEGITAVTDFGRDELAEAVYPYLSSGDYKGAMLEYARTMDNYFRAESEGSPVDTYDDYDEEPEVEEEKTTSPGAYAGGAGIAVAGGFGLSFAATGAMKRKMKSVRQQTSASAYADQEGFHLTENTDRYLYHRVVAVPIPRDNNNRPTGGSSVHISSSGSTHGGGSLGKF